MVFFSRSHVPAKIEDNFDDTYGIPIGKVQFSLLVAFLRPATSKGNIYLQNERSKAPFELCGRLKGPSKCSGSARE